MDILSGILNFFLFVFLFNIMFSIVSFILNAYRNRVATKEDENEIRTNLNEKNQEEVVEMVADEECGLEIPINKAFILTLENGEKKYFCSWECREKYLKKNMLKEKVMEDSLISEQEC